LLCSLLHSPVASSVLGPNVLLSTLFSSTLSLCSSLSVRDQEKLHTDTSMTFWCSFQLSVPTWTRCEFHSWEKL
jgi:hypothetical protein